MEIEISFHSIECGQSALDETPDGFDSIDIDSMGGKMLAFVNSEMLVVAEITQAIRSFPSIRMNDRFEFCPTSDDPLERFGRAIWNHLGMDAPISFVDPEDRVIHGSMFFLERTGSSTEPRRTEEAFIHFKHNNECFFLRTLVSMNHVSKTKKIAVDGLSVQPQQESDFRRIDVDAKALDNFSDPIITDLVVSENLSSLSDFR